ncbi:MAG: ImmA/IrrE family metallo-endopeptidase [Pirellulales bacterium]|nr:ImmA/IrrE family metallo-endopeptidase [Pirellulales bacterium]
MTTDIPEEQVRAAVEGVALEVLAEGGVYAPPVDAMLLAGRLGMMVARDGVSQTRARFVRLNGDDDGGTILLAEEPRPERRHWAVAHEIGESYAYRVFEELGLHTVDAAPAAREAVANRLAGCLLLPRDWLMRDGAALDWDLLELKARYATASHEMIGRRMLEMPPPLIITLADHGRQQWRRSNRYLRAPAMTQAETDAWQAAHRQGAATRCERGELPEGVEDVRAWPIHEPQWKREIVRTELSEGW